MTAFYHMHGNVVGSRDGSCRTVGTTAHDSMCSRMGFTRANEVRCSERSGTHSPEVKFKCVHELPDTMSGILKLQDGWYRVEKKKIEFVPLNMDMHKASTKTTAKKPKSVFNRTTKKAATKKAVTKKADSKTAKKKATKKVTKKR